MTGQSNQRPRREPSAFRAYNVLPGLAAAIFGISGIVSLSHSHYVAAAWYFLPTIGVVLGITQPPVVVRVPRPGPDGVTTSEATPWTWQRLVGMAALGTWFLTLPMGFITRHNLHHHHDLATILFFAVPAICSIGLVCLVRLRMRCGSPRIDRRSRISG